MEKVKFLIREYRTEDCAEMVKLFYETVHTVNIKHYSEEQCAVWADGHVDLEKWNISFLQHKALVAELNEKIIGFGDMDDTGYLDRLYVHKDYQGIGVASAICDRLEGEIPAKVYRTHASITAKLFFEKRGYRVIREQQVERKGVLLTNFVMEKRENTMNIYDDLEFFKAYAGMSRSQQGLDGAGEWHQLEPLFPKLKEKNGAGHRLRLRLAL